MSVSFDIQPNPGARSDAEVAEILASPGFGVYFTDHMVSITWTKGQGWHSATVKPYGPLTLDPASHEVRLDGIEISLSAREFGILHALMEAPGVPLSRSQLEERLYGWQEEIGSNAVEVHIHHLRAKLGADFIRTVRGLGYKLQ